MPEIRVDKFTFRVPETLLFSDAGIWVAAEVPMVGEMKDCYGRMFPPVIRQPDNVRVAGRVLSYRVEHPGMMSTDRSVSVDEKAWRQCVRCGEHESCYRLSVGMLLLGIAIIAWAGVV